MENVLLLPRWMLSLKLYKNDSDFYVSIGELDEKSLSANYIIGVSLGALVALRDIKNIKGKIILINPPVPKRSVTKWFARWMKFIMSEGLFLERQKFTINPIRYIFVFIECMKLFNVDFSKTLDNVSRDKVTVIRGKNDKYFCDESAVHFLRSKNIRIIEVDNSGHNWSEGIEKTLDNLLRK